MASKIPNPASASAARPFRIFALPLARLPRGAARAQIASSIPSSTPTAPGSPGTSSNAQATDQPTAPPTPSGPPAPLILFHTSQPDPSPDSTPSLLSKALNKASDQWLKLGEKDKKSWMYWFYARGEKLMDRIEFEEWALKGIKEGEGVRVGKDGKVIDTGVKIPLLRPTLQDAPLPPLIPKLHRLLIHRIPYHRKMMYRSIFASPLTAPFALIPIIPNFPMFYVLWRAWSHYKAWRGALYLETLLKSGLIVEQESEKLSDVFRKTESELEALNAAAKGAKKDRAPDETSSEGVKLGESSEANTASGQESSFKTGSGASASASDLPPQATGQSAAPDGTATPSSLVYSASSSTASPASVSPSSSSTTPAPKADTDKLDQPFPIPAPGPITSKAHHPSLLLTPPHIRLLTREFALRPHEVMDITRAVEQADFRARKRDEERAKSESDNEKEKEASAGPR